MKTLGKRLLPALLALALLAGCGQERTQPEETTPMEEASSIGNELLQRQAADNVFTLNYDPDAGINPLKADSAANMQFWHLIYDSLYTVDDDFSWYSEIVTEERTEDYVWWVFEINTEIVFSDGTPLTAQDIAYSIQRAQQTNYYSGRLSCIYGISALSDHSFAITASQANSQLPAQLNIPIIKKGEYFEDFPLGSGPYMLSEMGDSLVLNPRSRHAGEMPIDTIYLRDFMDTSDRITAFEDARLDIVTNDPTGMYNLGYGSINETRYFDTTNMHYIGFNTRSNYFQSSEARCAVGYVIDRDYVVTTLMGGCGVTATLPVHPKSGLFDEDYAATFRYDPSSAAALFEVAGVEDLDHDGELEIMVTGIVVEMDIKFIVNNDSTVKVRAARKICDELNALGITTTLHELSWEDYITALERGNYDMYYGEVRLSPDWDLGYLFKVPSDRNREKGVWDRNYARNMDSSYDRLYAAYLAANDADRYDEFQNLAHYIGGSGLILPICFERREVLTHRNAISGVRATQYDLFNRFAEWNVTLES